MRSLKITIPGDYWDCWLYRNLLYLWTLDGELVTYRWTDIVDSFSSGPEDQLALTCAFFSGSYLYAGNLELLFEDPEVWSLLESRFESMSSRELVFSVDQVTTSALCTQENPFASLPVDLDVYEKKVYAATDRGLFSATCGRRESEKYAVSTRPVHIWDCRLSGIDVRSRRLALAAGEEGLFECYVGKGEGLETLGLHLAEQSTRDIYRVSERDCQSASWTFSSVFATSHTSPSYMAGFSWVDEEGDGDTRRKRRAFARLVEHDDIFSGPGFSFGTDEKLCSVCDDDSIEVVRFTQKGLVDPEKPAFKAVGELHRPIANGGAAVLSGAVALFGTILEWDGGLTVLQSDERTTEVLEPVTRWRTYPRSSNYQNQLHVILDDRIEIYAFLHDAFVNQDNKISGIEFRSAKFNHGAE